VRAGGGVLETVRADVTSPAELANPDTLIWAKNQSANTMRLAHQIESLGHEQTVASARQETTLYKSRGVHSSAVSRFRQKIVEAGVVDIDIVDRYKPAYAG